MVALVHGLVAAVLNLGRHHALGTYVTDLGVMDQILWHLSRGERPMSSIVPPYLPANYFGWHTYGLLPLFTPLYWIAPSAGWVILGQAAMLAVGSWPVYRAVRALGHDDETAFWWGITYFNPFLIAASAWDFHPVSQGCLLIAFAAWGLAERRGPWFAAALVALALTQEHYGLAVAGFGVTWWRITGERGRGAAIAVAGLAAFVFTLFVAMPWIRGGPHPMLAAGGGTYSRYDWLHAPLPVAARTGLQLGLGLGAWTYFTFLFSPLAFLPLGALSWLAPAAGDLLANLLSSNPMPRSPFSYHSVSAVPLLVIAAAASRGRSRGPLKQAVARARLAAGLSLCAAYALAPLPLPGAANVWEYARLEFREDPGLAAVRAVVGSGSVAAQNNVGVHLTHRRHLTPFPFGLEGVDYAVLNFESPRRPHARFAEIFDLPYGVSRPEYVAAVRRLLGGTDFAVVHWCPPWLVMRRGGTEVPGRAAAKAALDSLEASFR